MGTDEEVSPDCRNLPKKCATRDKATVQTQETQRARQTGHPLGPKTRSPDGYATMIILWEAIPCQHIPTIGLFVCGAAGTWKR